MTEPVSGVSGRKSLQGGRRVFIALASGLAIPNFRFGHIFLHAIAQLVKRADIILRFGMALISGLEALTR